MTSDEQQFKQGAYRLVLVLVLSCVGLLLTVVYLLATRADAPSAAELMARDPELRDQVASRLSALSSGIYDSHIDPEVGRILQSELVDRSWNDTLVSSNRVGLRERPFVLPKPDHIVRVVLLGDSFVYGYGAAAEDRLGVFLEQWLNERGQHTEAQVEVLHLGIPSWNFRAEVAYLTRQLTLLDPDLVIHISVPNDIEDSSSIRGFGGPARFSSQFRHRADSLIDSAFPARVLNFQGVSGRLRWAIDHEGVERYRDSVQILKPMARLIEQTGSGYRLLLNYRRLLSVGREYLGRHLDPKQVVYLASSFGDDPQFWVSEQNSHWNRAGHRRVAQLIYGLIVQDELLPQVDPRPWDKAAVAVEEVVVAGQREAEQPVVIPNFGILAQLDLTQLDPQQAAQIHGGVDHKGRLSPYASLMLRNDGEYLRIEGQHLFRRELNGTEIRVSVDGEPVGVLEVAAGEKVDVRFVLPAIVADRPNVTVRFEASNYVYVGKALQHCVAFDLERIGIDRP